MLLGKAHVGGANRGDLVVAAWRRLGGRSELLAQQIQCAQADRELQFDLVLEIGIDQRARDPRLARDIVHLRGVKAGAREHDLGCIDDGGTAQFFRSEEHTSELQSLMRISYAVFCLKKKTKLS